MNTKTFQSILLFEWINYDIELPLITFGCCMYALHHVLRIQSGHRVRQTFSGMKEISGNWKGKSRRRWAKEWKSKMCALPKCPPTHQTTFMPLAAGGVYCVAPLFNCHFDKVKIMYSHNRPYLWRIVSITIRFGYTRHFFCRRQTREWNNSAASKIT